MIKARLKAEINRMVAPLGLQVLRLSQSPRPESLFNLLERHKIAPRTVFDIGVAEGTPWLYHAYPNAHYHLIDPTRESMPFMQQWAKHLDAEVHNCAMGDADTQQTIFVRKSIDESTLYEEIGKADVREKYEVPVRRFDSLIADFESPALAKIDVQGAEIAVIRGMGDRIHEIDVFIIETSTIATIKSGPELSELLSLMHDKDYVVFDIVGLRRRPLDGALAQMDVVFVRSDSSLRADRRWAS
ncbi:FkbM family methyltransferase [Mycobacterium sp. Y57]|uniref:FkbM family methyltransferase n=1 Tax=Mycolicibacterium xanthum TaxID=2796469 RepID=UPI001C84AC6C|nr:FkbM family methyltransferase [Mycolicibacterium xanthum]MBX7435576.1 FkbM family methyltransferase [Mycolicibacterium xanthum]